MHLTPSTNFLNIEPNHTKSKNKKAKAATVATELKLSYPVQLTGGTNIGM